MKHLLTILCLLLAVPAQAEWTPTGDGNYLWTDLTGKSDGWLYNWYQAGYYGQWYSKAVRPLTAAELQQIQPQQQQQPYVQNNAEAAAYAYGNGQGAPEKGWQSRALEVVSKRDETNKFMEFMQKHFPPPAGYQSNGYQNGQYSMQSPYGAMQSLSIQQAGGNPASILIGDLPLQQGNSVYGSVDPTYNTFAEPLRQFDFGSLANTLANMDLAREAGAVRISSETRAILGQITDSARVLHELQMRSQLVQQQTQAESEKWKALAALMTPSRSQTVQIQTDRNGTATFRVLPPASGGGVDGSSAPPPLPVDPGEDLFSKFSAVATRTCLRCHGGAETGSGSEKLALGKGTTLDLSGVNDEQINKIFARVKAGTMPPGGKMDAADRRVFDEMELMLKAGAREAAPAPKSK